MIRIKNGLVFHSDGEFRPAELLVRDGKIAGMGKDLSGDCAQTVDAGDCYVVPGFVDIHTHGAAGCDVMTATCGDLDKISLFYASRGVTSFLPTTMTMPVVDIVKALENIRTAVEKGTPGARILGINLEGPFINRSFKGAHPEEYIMHPSVELIDSLIKKSGGHIRVITIAPELEGVLDFAERFRESGIVFAIGHSALNSSNAGEAFKRGITHVTHLFNAMMGIHHREPGLAGSALDCGDVTVEIIADGIHIHPSVLRMVVRCKSPRKVVLITDSTMAAGLDDGEYTLGGQRVIVKNREARLSNGVLSGSTLTMADAVRNMVVKFGIPLEQALIMASETPAGIIGWGAAKGSLAVGKDADLVFLDKDLNVVRTFVEGREVFKR